MSVGDAIDSPESSQFAEFAQIPTAYHLRPNSAIHIAGNFLFEPSGMPTSRPNRKPQIPVHSRHPTYLEQSIAIYFHLQLLYVVGDFLLLAGAISVQNENLKNSPG